MISEKNAGAKNFNLFFIGCRQKAFLAVKNHMVT